MTQKDQDYILSNLKTIEVLLGCCEGNPYAAAALDMAKLTMDMVGGKSLKDSEALRRRISDIIRQLDESAVWSTSINEIARECGVNFMSHSDKIHCARELQARGYQRRRRASPDGMDWYYLKLSHRSKVAC